jgi:hypothetical protein
MAVKCEMCVHTNKALHRANHRPASVLLTEPSCGSTPRSLSKLETQPTRADRVTKIRHLGSEANTIVLFSYNTMEANVPFVNELPRYVSKVNKQSPEYVENYQAMTELVNELKTRLEEEGTYQGRDTQLRRHIKRGQLLGKYRTAPVDMWPLADHYDSARTCRARPGS